MRDKWLVVVAVTCSLAGLATLFVMVQEKTPVLCEIASLQLGEYVACEGIVYSVKKNEGHVFAKIFDGATLNVPFFNYDGIIEVGDLVYVEGIPTLYNDEFEIIPKQYEITEVYYGVSSDSQLHTCKGVFQTELDDGVHAVTGAIDELSLTVEKEIPSHIFVPFQGKISSGNQKRFKFFLFGIPQTFFSTQPITIGEISGFGIHIEEEIFVLYYQWKELTPESIAQAKKRPEGYPVKVSGTIQAVRESEGNIFLVIADSTGCILVPVFENKKDYLGVSEFYAGQTIMVTGILSFYKNAPEILPEEFYE
ncbi:MAG: hypothetical protein HXS44_00245 [Theionarchaea archaeon]|nr:hypothetical protein [Theionarchaea archaeon]